MSELRLERLTIATAAVGGVNPLPSLFSAGDLHQSADTSEADEEMHRNIGFGRVTSVLPYLARDTYDRRRAPAEHHVAVLENEHLRATFLLGSGGRLWSLVDLGSGAELLHRNPVFQPANLALRNAWFAGGVEWNVGTIGHSPTTTEPVHAVRLELPDGTPMLRMYEYERLREVVFQVDVWLPGGCPVLLVHVRISNPGDAAVPMYWWSNCAVPQAADVRVLAPATTAWQLGRDRRLRRVPVPVLGGLDRSYPARAPEAADYFFELDGGRPWVAAVDGTGRGLVQTSTRQLRGRKLFVWGTGPGGRRWQEWLSGPDAEYLEIQAGLARTQLEHLPMPGRTHWSWVEAYGALRLDPARAHSPRWDDAVAAGRVALDELVSEEALEHAHALATQVAAAPPLDVLHTGSGWGALERQRRSDGGDDSLVLSGTPFSDATLGAEQQPWLELLREGRMTDPPAADAPSSYQVGAAWGALLDNTATGWLEWLHLGVVRAHAGDHSGARAAWDRSVAVHETAWARRNLGVLAERRGDRDLARREYHTALRLHPDLPALRLELVELLLADGRGDEAQDVLDAADEHTRSLGRFRYAAARAALLAEDLDRAAQIIESGLVVPDLREGELALDELWYDYETLRRARADGVPVSAELRARVRASSTLPRAFDFRMFSAPPVPPSPPG